MVDFKTIIQSVGDFVEVFGVLVIVSGTVIATGHFLRMAYHHYETAYQRYRRSLGRAILLGLEFLVAGDLIRTVVISPTMENALILGLIVLIRSFLSMALELEIEGRWPWQGRRTQQQFNSQH